MMKGLKLSGREHYALNNINVIYFQQNYQLLLQHIIL